MRAWSDRGLGALLLALAFTCLLGWLFKAHCTGGGWTGAEQYITGCYTDALPFWGGRGVAAGAIPYFEARLEYPVLTGALIWAEGAIVRTLFGSGAGQADFLAIVTLANALLAGAVLVMLWRAGLDRIRLWAWACAPPLVLYLGHNWDMLAITLAVGAMLLAREGRLARSAAAAGLGCAAKLFPVLLLPLLGLNALFEPGAEWRRRLTRAALLSAAAVGAWAVVNLPVAAFAFANWSEFYTFSSERSGTAAALWDQLAYAGLLQTDIPTRNRLAGALFLAGAALILGFGWRRHQGRLWVLFTPMLAWFMLTNKVYSPQFDLWLYPLLLMTAPRLAPVALFTLAGIAAYFAEFWFFAGMEGASPAATMGQIGLAAGVRGAAMLWAIADAVRLPPPVFCTPRRRA